MTTTQAAPTAGPTTGPVSSKVPLTPEQLKAFGEEMDAIRQRVLADLGEADAAYIRKVVKYQRGLEVAGRAMFYLPPAWPLAVAALSLSKILDNMEIGHNVMHGQYDWMGDPNLSSRIYERHFVNRKRACVEASDNFISVIKASMRKVSGTTRCRD